MASTIVAVRVTVPAIARVSAAGATVTTNDPSVALIGVSPTRGASTNEMVAFVPARMATITDLRCVSTPPASKACIVIVRPEPAGRVIVPDATPLAMEMLNTRSVVMSGAVTSSTRLAVAAADNGWTIFRGGRHPIAGGAEVLYLEDRDGFEVELVAAIG